jgi:putative chitinase
MSVLVTIDQILRLAPNTRSSYRDAFQNGQTALEQSGIADSPLRIAHFLAQVLHESMALTVQFENLNYSPERLPKVWPSRFKPKGHLEPEQFAHNPEALANEVYGKRMGNVDPNDGFTYRGRGLLQLTGRESYQAATTVLRKDFPDVPDFVANPDEVISPQWCLVIAAAEWRAKGCNEMADKDDIKAITKAINGGLIGLAERMEWARRTKAVWG